MPAPYAAYVVDTTSDLVNPQTTGQTEVTVLGRLTKGDGGGGVFYWVTGTGPYTSDNGTVFPISAAGASPAGAWLRVIDGVYNVKWFAVKGDGSIDETSVIANALAQATTAKRTLYFPVGTYIVNGTIIMKSYTHLKGEGIGKTIIKYTTPQSASSYMFETDGANFIEIEGFTFTGDHIHRISAFIGLNSYPNHNREFYIHHNEFTEAACSRAINLGNSDSGSSSNTDVYIQYNWFHELYETNYQNVTDISFPDGHTCKGINMKNSTRLIDVSYNRFENISSDGVYGDGSNTGGGYLQGNCNIHHNIFYNTWMGVEINGLYMGYNQTIENNYFYWMRCNAGYAISTAVSYNVKIRGNFIYQHDRGAIEFGTIGGVIEGNTIVITPYVSGEGYAGTSVYGSISAISARGYANTITNNSFILGFDGTNGYTGSTPGAYKAISIGGKSFNSSTQPSIYNNIPDAAIWTITDNYFENPNGQVVVADIQTAPIRNVYITNNLITSRFAQSNMIEIHGYNWHIKNNTFDMTDSTPGGSSLIGIYYQQLDDTVSLVSENTIINDAWKLSTSGRYVAYKNTFRGTSNTTPYLLYPAPTVTATQKAALTGVEGMTVYQTDGTVGMYIFTGGAWKRVDLV